MPAVDLVGEPKDGDSQNDGEDDSSPRSSYLSAAGSFCSLSSRDSFRSENSDIGGSVRSLSTWDSFRSENSYIGGPDIEERRDKFWYRKVFANSRRKDAAVIPEQLKSRVTGTSHYKNFSSSRTLWPGKTSVTELGIYPVKPPDIASSVQIQNALVAGIPQLKRSEVKTACESFSNIIGSLSDGTIYKGYLPSGVEIAVSVIMTNKHWSVAHETQYKKKIAVLSRVNHRNFMNLLTYCKERDPFTRMLIFEYVPNGTLSEHLLNSKEPKALSWSSRLRIAVGVAHCLDYLHQLMPPIILENLDSNVIYLTDDFAAKVSDMELWSKTAEGDTGTRTPESLQHEMPNKDRIVHKFGIVLLELLSGRRPYSDENYDQVSWASDYLMGKKPLKEMIDPELTQVREEDVKPLFEVIMSCLKPNPFERPTMEAVATRLMEITEIPPEGAAPTP